MARYQLFRNHENDDDVAAFRRLAMLHRQNARDANPRGNDLDFILPPVADVHAAGIREARCERVTVNGSSLRYFASCSLPLPGGYVIVVVVRPSVSNFTQNLPNGFA